MDGGEVLTIGALITHSAAAVFGSSKAAGVDRHETAITGFHGRAVGWAVVGKWTAVGHGNSVIYKDLTHTV